MKGLLRLGLKSDLTDKGADCVCQHGESEYCRVIMWVGALWRMNMKDGSGHNIYDNITIQL